MVIIVVLVAKLFEVGYIWYIIFLLMNILQAYASKKKWSLKISGCVDG